MKRFPHKKELDLRIVAHLRRILDPLRNDVRFQTQAQVSEKCGFDKSTISKIIAGRRGVGLDVLYRLKTGLDLSADWFLDDVPREELSQIETTRSAKEALSAVREERISKIREMTDTPRQRSKKSVR